jgi:NADP-dependent 3-hydroxy acid dehydrogenase YdfG
MARRKEAIDELTNGLQKKNMFKSISLQCDVRSLEQVQTTLNSLPDEWKNIDILINNAGLSRGLEKLHEGLIDDWDEMIDTNIKGVLYISRTVIPWMVARGEGMVINIGSLAGNEIYPGGAVYCGTKHALKAISKGMAIDLNGTGIRVANLEPGLVETEFSLVRFHGDKDRAENVYKGYTPLSARDVAETALFIATRPSHVMIQNILITPTDQASASVLNKKID